jgi:hypothetical protein
MMTPQRLATALIIVAAMASAGSLPDAPAAKTKPPYDPGKAAFQISFGDTVIPYTVFAVYVLPGATVTVAAQPGVPGQAFDLSWSSGEGQRDGVLSWSWSAPADPCLTSLVLRETTSSAETRLNVFVMVPIERVQDEHLNGYRIGSYPKTPFKGLAIYRPPRGLVEVTRGNVDTRVSPHFTIGQFLCKQAGGYPKYLILRPMLLLKIEMMLEKVNQAGVRCDTFHVMSGYRTPFYNHAIRNVKYSRHQWGGAADVFVDVKPEDGLMDDLNGDGRIDVRDARHLYNLVDDLYGASWYAPYVGGLGLYRTTANHGPFIHVDVRGFRARWGD